MSDQDHATSIRKIVRIEAKPGLTEEARAALLDLERATAAEPGCREFRFYQSLGDAGAFILIEDFAGPGALEEHMRLPHTRAFFDRDLVASIRAVDPRWLQ